MLLTKGEFKGILLEVDYVDEVIAELVDSFGQPQTRDSLASGYVRKGYNYMAIYSGRFGVGITVRYRNTESTRFCHKKTYIFDGVITRQIEYIIERVFYRHGIEVKPHA